MTCYYCPIIISPEIQYLCSVDFFRITSLRGVANHDWFCSGGLGCLVSANYYWPIITHSKGVQRGSKGLKGPIKVFERSCKRGLEGIKEDPQDDQKSLLKPH